DTSDGSRSGVNWMRRHAPATLAAMARASVVLPTPGTSSTSMCPGANNAVTASRTRSGLPSTTEPIEAVSRAAVSVKTPISSGVSGSAGVIAAAPGRGWLLDGSARRQLVDVVSAVQAEPGKRDVVVPGEPDAHPAVVALAAPRARVDVPPVEIGGPADRLVAAG